MHYATVTKEFETKNLGKKEVKFTVPQADNVEELTGASFYGSEQELVDRTNKVIARGAVAGGSVAPNLALEKATNEAEWQEAEKKGLAAAKSYKPEISTGVSQKEAKKSVDSLIELKTKHAGIFAKFSADEVFKFMTEQELPEWAVTEMNAAA